MTSRLTNQISGGTRWLPAVANPNVLTESRRQIPLAFKRYRGSPAIPEMVRRQTLVLVGKPDALKIDKSSVDTNTRNRDFVFLTSGIGPGRRRMAEQARRAGKPTSKTEDQLLRFQKRKGPPAILGMVRRWTLVPVDDLDFLILEKRAVDTDTRNRDFVFLKFGIGPELWSPAEQASMLLNELLRLKTNDSAFHICHTIA